MKNRLRLDKTILLLAKKDFLMRTMLIIFLFFSLSTGSAYAVKMQSENAKLSIALNNQKVSTLIDIIEKETGYLFVYNEDEVDTERSISVNYEKENLKDILHEVFSPLGVSYAIEGNGIMLKKTNPKNVTEGGQNITEEKITVKGTVIDAIKEPIIGVSVTLQGSKEVGTITDINGNFTINVPKDAVLIFSYIGYRTETLPVNGKTTLDLVLQEDSKALEEVVVVGYGTQKKINLTGAVTSVSAEDMKDRPVTEVTQLLQGVIPNLNVTFGQGKPGTSGSINIRGTTSINGGSPMVLIDGVMGTLDRINASDVETVTVLKDASAAAVYGARAAFGVILVTTKKGKEGKFQINYKGSYGIATHNTKTDYITSGYWNAKINDDAMYNALGYGTLRYSEEDYDELWARVNDRTEHPDRPWVVTKKNAAGRDMYRYYGNFDWFNYFYNDARPRQNHNVTITGGSDKVNYMLSGSYSKEQGIFNINPDMYQRYNTRTRIEANPYKWLTISSNTHFFKSSYDWYGVSNPFNSVSNNVSNSPTFHYHAAYVPRNPDGTLTGATGVNSYQIGTGYHNALESGTMKGYNKGTEYLTTYEAIVRPLTGLSLTANYTYREFRSEYMYRQTKQYYSKYPGVMELSASGALKIDKLNENMTKYFWNIINLYANYEKSIGNHNLSGMVGFNQEGRNYKRLQADGQELLSESLNDLNFVTAEEQNSGGGDEWRTRGIFGRINYDYKGKYLFEMSGRYDGTSRFPKKDRFGFFPSFSLGWRMSEEAFFDPLKNTIDNLKIRYSYGTLGNQEVSTYAYIASMGTGTINYLQNGSKLNVVNHPGTVAKSLTWETATTNNLGLDLSLLKSRLNFSMDIYQRDTKEMLTKGKTLPSVYGASEPKENAANLRTRGFELSLSWNDRVQLGKKPLSYSVTAILSDYSSEITKYDNPEGLISDYYVGQKFGEIWGYSYDGFFKTTEEAQEWAKIVDQDKINKRRVQAPTEELRMLQAGDIKILDLDGDGIIDTGANTLDDPGDRRIIGNTTPRYSYGFSLSADWNGIDFYMLLQGIGRRHWYPHLESQPFWSVYARPYDSFIPSDFPDKIWSEDNPNSYFPFLRGYTAQNSELSVANDMYLQDLAYCKLRNLTIGYSLPRNILEKIKLDKVRFYVSGENLFTWTKLDTKYLDPESVMSDVTGRSYPMSKIFSFGIEVGF